MYILGIVFFYAGKPTNIISSSSRFWTLSAVAVFPLGFSFCFPAFRYEAHGA